MRYGQVHDALHAIRSNLRIRSYVLKYKDRNLRGQGANTRAHNTLKRIEARIDMAASRYGATHTALVRLSPLLKKSGWSSVLHPLLRADIRGMSDLLDGETEGTRKISWIWNMHGATGDDVDADGALQGQ